MISGLVAAAVNEQGHSVTSIVYSSLMKVFEYASTVMACDPISANEGASI